MNENTAKNMELTYNQCGDYLLPNVTLEEKSYQPGFYGEKRRQYLMEHRKAMYSSLLLKNFLAQHLEEIDQQAREISDRLTLELMQAQGATEQLKQKNQMEWVQKMNNIQNSVRETILSDLIYV